MNDSHISKMNDPELGDVYIYRADGGGVFAVSAKGTSGSYESEDALVQAYASKTISWSGGVPEAATEPADEPQKKDFSDSVVKKKRGRKKKS